MTAKIPLSFLSKYFKHWCHLVAVTTDINLCEVLQSEFYKDWVNESRREKNYEKAALITERTDENWFEARPEHRKPTESHLDDCPWRVGGIPQRDPKHADQCCLLVVCLGASHTQDTST